MQNHRDNYAEYDENSIFEMAVYSTIGNRDEQQDSSGYEIKNDEGIVVVCDGMGGHDGGKLASGMAVSQMLEIYNQNYPSNSIFDMLLDAADLIDNKISGLCREDGTAMRSGSTLISAVIKNKFMQWVSVGDSRIYFYRNEELIQLTKDHNYLTQLQYRMEKGKITADEFESEKSKSEVLVSFMGVGGLSMIDCNAIPLALASGDEILMTTDGLYRLLDDSEICNILLNFKNINEALQALESKARRAAKHKNMSRDNMTVTLIKIK